MNTTFLETEIEKLSGEGLVSLKVSEILHNEIDLYDIYEFSYIPGHWMVQCTTDVISPFGEILHLYYIMFSTLNITDIKKMLPALVIKKKLLVIKHEFYKAN